MENRIIDSLDAFIRKYYKNRLIKGLIYSVALLLSLFIVVVLLEYFGYFPPLVRAVLFWLYIAVSVFVLARFVVLPLAKMYRLGHRISYEQAAVIIGNYFPEVKDKLLNLLQLQQMSSSQDSDLLQAGIEQKTSSLSPIPFRNAINLAANKKYIKYAAIPLISIAISAIAVPSFITEPAKRLTNYNTYYERPAPFSFVIENECLEVAQQEDFLLRVAVIGSALPADVYILIDGKRYKMKQQDRTHFSYLFKQQRSLSFSFTAASVTSPEYTLVVLPRPSIVDFQVTLTYPAYTHQQSVTFPNQGDLVVSQGTSVQWLFLTKDVDTLFFLMEGTSKAYVPNSSGRIMISHRAMQTFSYGFFVRNSRVSGSDTLRYTVSVVPDVAPMIAVAEAFDSSFPERRFFQGRIKDDYGFTRLELVIVKTNATDTSIHQTATYPVAIGKEVSQEFLFSFDFNEIVLSPGDRLQYYFEVWDNDAIHGSKSSTSQQFAIEVPTERELEQILNQNSVEVMESASKSMSELKKLQEEINDLMRSLVDKRDMGWQEKKQLQELAEKQKQVRDELQKMQQQIQENNRLEEKYREQSEQIRQKQEELDKLFNEVLNDEMKEMMKEIDKLMEQMDKQKVQEQLENLKLDNEQLEKQIDQNIDLLKRLEVEKKVENAIRKTDELAEKQHQLAEETEQSSLKDESSRETLQHKQEELTEQFKELQKEIEQIQKDYKEIDPNIDFKVDKNLEQQIEQKQQEAQQQMEKKKSKEASNQQKSAAEDMQKLSEQLAQEQMEMEQQNLAEDSELIRRLLKSLVHLSFDQEGLIDKTNRTYIQDPVYQEIISLQNKIKDDFRNVEDSLSSIAKRQVSVASAITREVSNVNTNIAKSMAGLLRYNQSFYGGARNTGVTPAMQYGMTALNNLSLLLAESLDDMQNQMRQNAMQQQGSSQQRQSQQKKGGSCQKPGNSKPSPKSMRQMQQELNKQMEALKKQLEKEGKNQNNGRRRIGEGSQTSEEFSKMAAQQEMIRRMMQKYGQEIKQQNAGNGQLAKEIDEMMRQMEQTETDLVNKTISQQTLQRQQQIMTRLLEHEKAEMQREKEDRRQSREASEQYRPSPSDLERFEQLKKTNMELFRTMPPSLTPYYKYKVSSYFYNF